MKHAPVTIALPKGRLLDSVIALLAKTGIELAFEDRLLMSTSKGGEVTGMLVKNSDLPTYVHHGIAGLGICGDDVLFEAGYPFFNLHTFSFGSTKMCLAGRKDRSDEPGTASIKVATKFTRFSRTYFHEQGTQVEIVKLGGSVELAPVLGLTPYIVDLVETGNTLKAHDLEVIQTLKTIKVHLVANQSYYKMNYEKVNEFVDLIKKADSL